MKEGVDISKDIDETRQGEATVIEGNQTAAGKKLYVESYGCAMNFSDSEIVASILTEEGYSATQTMESADLILVNTCSIREKAEDNIRQRLRIFNKVKIFNMNNKNNMVNENIIVPDDFDMFKKVK